MWARQATSPNTKPSSYPATCWLHLNHSCQIPVQSVHYFHTDRRFSGLVDQSLFFCDLCPVWVSKDARLLLACWHLKNIALLLTFKKTYAGIFSYAGKISYDLWPFCKRWVAHYASAVGVAEENAAEEWRPPGTSVRRLQSKVESALPAGAGDAFNSAPSSVVPAWLLLLHSGLQPLTKHCVCLLLGGV